MRNWATSTGLWDQALDNYQDSSLGGFILNPRQQDATNPGVPVIEPLYFGVTQVLFTIGTEANTTSWDCSPQADALPCKCDASFRNILNNFNFQAPGNTEIAFP